jgi:hypothetical protein
VNRIILYLIFFFSIYGYSQTAFHSLGGMESNEGHTLLFYRSGESFFYYNPIYKLNTQTLSTEMIINAYSGTQPWTPSKGVWDFEFFPGMGSGFIYVGEEINPDNHGFISKNNQKVFGGMSGYYRVDISKNDPEKVFVFGPGPIMVSLDGGDNFEMSTSLPFNLISLAEFDESKFFGFGYDFQLIRYDDGITIISDTSRIFFDQYFSLLYDADNLHMYRVNSSLQNYYINVSPSRGDEGSWNRIFTSSNPLYLAIDKSQSGLLYFADGMNIYKSENHGYSYNIYRTLNENIIGLYKKPAADTLYAATATTIYRITPDGESSIFTIFSDINDKVEKPLEFALYPNHPNPFNPETRIKYSLQSREFVSLKIYDLTGREVATLVNEEKQGGTYELNWNAAGLSSGVYLCRMQAGSFVNSRKMVLLK